MVDNKHWIWEHNSYPYFEYDFKRLDHLTQEVSRKQGELIALSKMISQDSLKKTQLNALENEILSSSAIEGEFLDRDSVKSSIKERLGLEASINNSGNSKERNYVDILIDINTNHKESLTLERIFAWHYKMFENYNNKLWDMEIGSFRKKGTMQIISGAIGKEKVYYQAPAAENLKKEMYAYIEWFNTTPSSLIKAAIVHLWFVIIHPFDDGNGRITRALTDMVLSDIEGSDISKLYAMSKDINSDRKGYYHALEQTTGYIPKDSPMDITIWCEWFLQTLHKSISEAIASIEHVVHKSRFWDKHKDSAINDRQAKVLNIILDKGVPSIENGLSTKKYIKMAKTTSATASRDIKGLLQLGCIQQVEGTKGRNIRYTVVI